MRDLDAVRTLLQDWPQPRAEAADAVRARELRLTKPAGALGRLEALTAWLAEWQGSAPPRLDRVAARVFAGNHGVAARGVSAYPAAVTAQMVGNFRNGGAAVNQLCRAFDVALQVTPLDLDCPTADLTEGAAMDEDAFVRAFTAGFGIDLAGVDLLCLGEMGIGNTTAAAALAHALFGGTVDEWTGAGTGVEGTALQRKRELVADAVRLHRGQTEEPLQLARRLGGRELAAILGAVVAARRARVPVLLDGYVCTAAAAPLALMQAGALDHCRAAHVSAEPGHRRLLDRLHLQPLLDLELRLGEASGAVLAVGLLRAALACHTGMATFDEAAVSKPEAAGS